MEKSLEKASLTVEQVKKLFIYTGEKVQENKQLLTKIDGAIGDGDHGIGMSLGFKKANEKLRETEFTTVNEIFKTIGVSMISSMGGASGVIFGTLFTGGLKGLDPQETLDSNLLANILENALNAIKQRGKADLGDKTMIDALEPAVLALKQKAENDAGLLACLKAAEEAAAQGVEKTKSYIAKFGRAKTLGERAIGHQDAGATTVWIIFKSMKEYIENLSV